LACLIFSTNDEVVLLTIEGKWPETIVHMAKFEFLDLSCPEQVQLLISICIHGKFQLSTTYALVDFQEDIQQFIPQMETSLKGECLVTPSTIILNDNVHTSVTHKFDFDVSKSNLKKNPF